MSQGGSIIAGVLGEGRLDRALGEAVPDLSRERAKALIVAGAVRIEGVPASDPSSRRYAGQGFALEVPAPAPTELIPEAIALDIVHEDAALVVVNKPAGMVVHPAAGNERGTLVHALLHHCRGSLSGIGGVERPGIVHRIDKDTSGLLVVAKHDRAHEGLARQFAAHSIERVYKAIVTGRPLPPAGTVATRIGRSPHDRKKMAVLGGTAGKHAVSHYRTLAAAAAMSLVECRLETGRTHQIRVHMAHLGHGLVGDPLYGPRRLPASAGPVQRGFGRQALHAERLGFVHPESGATLSFGRPIPGDMQELFSEIGVYD